MKKNVSAYILAAAVSVFSLAAGETRCFVYAEDAFAELMKERIRLFAYEFPEYRTVLGSKLEKEVPVLAVSEREFPEKEYDSIPLAFCGTAIVVSRVNSIVNLSTKEALRLAAGKVSVWKGANVPLKKIYVVDGVCSLPVPDAKGPKVIPVSNGRTAGLLLEEDPGAVVLVPFDRLRECGAGTRIMTVNKAEPKPEDVLSGEYPLAKFYTLSCRKDAPAGIRAIWDDMRSPAFRKVLLKIHLLPLPEGKKKKRFIQPILERIRQNGKQKKSS